MLSCSLPRGHAQPHCLDSYGVRRAELERELTRAALALEGVIDTMLERHETCAGPETCCACHEWLGVFEAQRRNVAQARAALADLDRERQPARQGATT
jgi:hypothetical protein